MVMPFMSPQSQMGRQLGVGGARPQTQGLPVIPSPVRLNPDGSAAPTGGAGQPVDTLSYPNNPLTGAAANRSLMPGAVEATVRDNPTSIINDIFRETGMDPYAGLADQLAGLMSPDQLQTLVGILSASQGVIGSPGAQYNLINQMYEGLMGSSQLPSLAQIFGGAFQGGSGRPGTPYYGVLTGGDPGAQVGQLLGAVLDMADATGVNSLQARGLGASLNALAREYLSQSGTRQGANRTFVDYLKQNAPYLVGALGG